MKIKFRYFHSEWWDIWKKNDMCNILLRTNKRIFSELWHSYLILDQFSGQNHKIVLDYIDILVTHLWDTDRPICPTEHQHEHPLLIPLSLQCHLKRNNKWNTLSDEISADKSDENVACYREFCPSKYFFSDIFLRKPFLWFFQKR